MTDGMRRYGGFSDPKTGEEAAARARVERVFAELASLYGSRFADMWRETDLGRMKALWTRALAGFSGAELRAGLDGCHQRAWPPSLPEFMGLCRPRPDAEQAFRHAQEQVSRRAFGEDVWPEKALYWAAVAFGFYDLRTMAWERARTRWTAIWLEKRAQEAVLPPVPATRPALMAPGQGYTDRRTARQRLAALRAMLGGSGMTGGAPVKRCRAPAKTGAGEPADISTGG